MSSEVREITDSLFETSSRWGVAMVRMSAAIVGEHDIDRLRASLMDVTDRHGGRLILDASGIGTFNCSWMNTLLALSSRCISRGGQLFVTGLSNEALSILRATGLSSRLKTAASNEHALSAMGLTGTSTWRMAVEGFFKRKVA